MPPSFSAQSSGSALTVKSTGASTRWAASICSGLVGAVGGLQPVGKPFWRFVGGGKGGRQFRFLGARQRAQHAVDEAGKALRARVGLGVGHGKVDGGAVGNVEEQDLRRRHMQYVRQSGGVGRQRLFQAPRQQPRYGHAVAQRGDQYGAHQAAVAQVERLVLRMAVLVVGQPVERRPGIDDGGKQPRRRLAGGEAGDEFAAGCLVRSPEMCGPRLWRHAHDHRPLGPVGLRPHGLDFGLAGSAGGSGCAAWPHGPGSAAVLRPAVASAPGAARGLASAAVHVARHRLQRGDAVVGARVGGKQTVHALAVKGIDDEEMRHRRIALGIRVGDAFGAAGDLVKR